MLLMPQRGMERLRRLNNAQYGAAPRAAVCRTAWVLLAALILLLAACHPPAQKLPAPAAAAATDTSEAAFVTEHAKTGFPLLGYHASLPCDACHGERQPSRDCSDCHQSPHESGVKKCETCHTPGMPFASIKFTHEAKGLFSMHQDVPCSKCHEGMKFLTASRSCTSCHEDVHGSALGADCYECHRSTAWELTSFNHNMTGFPLLGAHRALECGDCHRDLRSFKIVPRPSSCASCHEKDYRASAFPHAAYGAGTNCEECHLQDSWSYAHSPTWFNIQTGHHAGASCAACHANPQDYREYTCHACHKGHANDNGGRCLDCHPGGFPGGEDD